MRSKYCFNYQSAGYKTWSKGNISINFCIALHTKTTQKYKTV